MGVRNADDHRESGHVVESEVLTEHRKPPAIRSCLDIYPLGIPESTLLDESCGLNKPLFLCGVVLDVCFFCVRAAAGFGRDGVV